jgi:hypothetical protein
MNDAPVVLSSHRIEVALSEEALPIGVHQLIDAVRVAAKFLVIQLDGAPVLLAAMDRLELFVAL